MEMWKKILNYGTALQLFLTAVDTPDASTAIFRYERSMPLGLLLRALPDLGHVSPKHIFENGDIRQNPANTELPVWMPIEQIFVSVMNKRVRNHSNTPRWASSSWHDLWMAS